MKYSVVGLALIALCKAHEEGDQSSKGMEMHGHVGHGAAHGSPVSKNTNTTANFEPSPVSSKGGHSHGVPILEMLGMLEPQQQAYWKAYDPTTYFSADAGSKALLYLHAALNFLALGVLLPMSSLLAFSEGTQWLYLPLQTLTFVMTAASAIVAMFYSFSLEESLYPGNCYGKVVIIFLATMGIHWISLVAKSATAGCGTALDGVEYHLTNFERPSQDSGNDCGDSIDEDVEEFAQPARQRPRMATKLAHSRFGFIFRAFNSCSSLVFWLTTVPLCLFGYAYLVIGGLIGTRLGMGHNVFGLLAHAIKGSVFFLFGFVELSRYFGAFASKGMAWNTVNIAFSKESARKPRWYHKFWPENPTMEFIHSFLIFFYGSTNIFLEHLGSKDGKWTAKDMQHASIAFMFLGGGLCGMVVESRAVSRFLSIGFNFENETTLTRSWSYNPFPLLTIFWTGALMSQHAQETELSTAIHVQWGTLLSGAALMRAITLVILYTKSNTGRNDLPQRPFTELITAFCLICGGMIFVMSNRETVEAMIYRGVSSMFSLILGVGITSLLMSGAALALAFKGWATR